MLNSWLNRLSEAFVRHPKAAVLLLIAAVYLPFMFDPILRTTGDEKTYVAQALEMERDGHWFVQSLADESDYYKGPLHFILLRIGFILFGHSMWATLYMNFLLITLAAMLLQQLFRTQFDEKRGWDILYAGGFALSVGLYGHMFASQMEAELVAFYAITLYLLWWIERDPGKAGRHLLLWGVVGLAGWLKSPLHSVLLGLSVLGFWAFNGTLWQRARSLKQWGFALFGVAVGAFGYAMILLGDGNAFIDTYIIRESLSKGANGVPWFIGFLPVCTYYLAPLMFPAMVAFFLAVKKRFAGPDIPYPPTETTLIKLAISLAVPTMLFFTLHPFRSEIYSMPAVSATWLLAVLLWRRYDASHPKAFRVAVVLNAGVFALVAGALAYAIVHLSPMPQWWPGSLLPLALFGLVFIPWFAWKCASMLREKGAALLLFAFVPFYLLVGTLLLGLGSKEMADLRSFIAKHPDAELGYYNLHRNVWNEWGYLNIWVDYPVKGIHNETALLQWLHHGHTLLVPGDKRLSQLQTLLREQGDNTALDIRPWKRWLTHGRTEPGGPSRFEAYWQSGDVGVIQKSFYIVTPVKR